MPLRELFSDHLHYSLHIMPNHSDPFHDCRYKLKEKDFRQLNKAFPSSNRALVQHEIASRHNSASEVEDSCSLLEQELADLVALGRRLRAQAASLQSTLDLLRWQSGGGDVPPHIANQRDQTEFNLLIKNAEIAENENQASNRRSLIKTFTLRQNINYSMVNRLSDSIDQPGSSRRGR
jgi:hypothetical protein